jgi:hypothetical protein
MALRLVGGVGSDMAGFFFRWLCLAVGMFLALGMGFEIVEQWFCSVVVVFGVSFVRRFWLVVLISSDGRNRLVVEFDVTLYPREFSRT